VDNLKGWLKRGERECGLTKQGVVQENQPGPKTGGVHDKKQWCEYHTLFFYLKP